MKTYEEALAKVQELIDEEYACRCEREELIERDLESNWDSDGGTPLEQEIGYLNWKIQSLKGRIPAALETLHFIYGEDGHDIYEDIRFHPSDNSLDQEDPDCSLSQSRVNHSILGS